jgi:hypothetical protein
VLVSCSFCLKERIDGADTGRIEKKKEKKKVHEDKTKIDFRFNVFYLKILII